MPDCYATIIGGGIIGTAVAYEMSSIVDRETICLIERNPTFPGENQTSRNSGVLHAGIYYDQAQTPLKATLCVEGNRRMYQFCREHNLPAQQTGKLVVATTYEEDKSLDDLLLRSRENDVPGVEKIDGTHARELEPNIKAYSALWVPTSGIVDPTSVVRKLRELSTGEYFLLGTEVTSIIPRKGEFIVKVSTIGAGDNEFSTKYLINAAGLSSDEVARMVNPEFPLKIFPVRGEAAKFYQSRRDLQISRNIYPVPLSYPKPDGSEHRTLGVHLTPTFSVGMKGDFAQDHGNFLLGTEVTVGPLNRKRGDNITKDDFGSDLAPPSQFREKIEPFFPGIRLEDLQLHQTGIQAVLANSQDFHIAPDVIHPRMINAVGICSPGLTASLAIATMVRHFLE